MGDGGTRLNFENRLDIELDMPAAPRAEKGGKFDARKAVEASLLNAVRNIPEAALRGVRSVRITVMA